eukprot:m51a1_g12698 hypothetical protein (281) ;mRNA; r:1974-3732
MRVGEEDEQCSAALLRNGSLAASEGCWPGLARLLPRGPFAAVALSQSELALCALSAGGEVLCSCADPAACRALPAPAYDPEDPFDLLAERPWMLWIARRARSRALVLWGCEGPNDTCDELLQVPEPNSGWRDVWRTEYGVAAVREASGAVESWGPYLPALGGTGFVSVSAAMYVCCAIAVDRHMACESPYGWLPKRPPGSWEAVVAFSGAVFGLSCNGSSQVWGPEGSPLPPISIDLKKHFQMHHKDYNQDRVLQGKPPLIFQVVSAWKVRSCTQSLKLI